MYNLLAGRLDGIRELGFDHQTSQSWYQESVPQHWKGLCRAVYQNALHIPNLVATVTADDGHNSKAVAIVLRRVVAYSRPSELDLFEVVASTAGFHSNGSTRDFVHLPVVLKAVSTCLQP